MVLLIRLTKPIRLCVAQRVALGFPDILFGPPDAFRKALQRLAATRADLVLGLYRVHDTRLSDMIAIDRGGRVREIVLRPCATKLKLGWMFAVWTPTFTEFMHNYLTVPRTAAQLPGTALPAELTVGHVIQAAIREGIVTQSIIFSPAEIPGHRYTGRIATGVPPVSGFAHRTQPDGMNHIAADLMPFQKHIHRGRT